MYDSLSRLKLFLMSRGETDDILRLTPDASTREYFRIGWKGERAIACVYPESFVAREHTYLDITNLFLSGGLPVADVFAYDESLGVIVQEDLGDRILRDVMLEADEQKREKLNFEAVSLIPKIQAATPIAVESGSIASRLCFDTEKLLWELAFFKTHYFKTYKNEPLSASDDEAVVGEFTELSRELESKARVLCHRDFHAANLMVDPTGRLRIIDHQDARLGSVAYDLASFLLDRVTEPPTGDYLAEKRRIFLTMRENLGLEQIEEKTFADEFRLQTIQRCLKAIGTFSFQSVNRGKTYFIPFIKPMFEIVLRATENLGRFPTIARVVSDEIMYQ
ncbi:MAG: phosphotransferase [Acidobacteria bacterium]|nr:phosphotransferase [Acidobacteriota bacterium]